MERTLCASIKIKTTCYNVEVVQSAIESENSQNSVLQLALHKFEWLVEVCAHTESAGCSRHECSLRNWQYFLLRSLNDEVRVSHLQVLLHLVG